MELKPPGEIDIAVAPLVAHPSVLLVPEVILVGFAPKDVIEGTGFEFEELVVLVVLAPLPQPTSQK